MVLKVGGVILDRYQLTLFLAQRESISPEPENGTFELIKGDEGDSRSEVQNNDAAIAAEQISAADYNPNLDRREDEEKRAQKDDDVQMVVEEEDYEEEEEDVDDMFAVASEKPKLKKVRKVIVRLSSHFCFNMLTYSLFSENFCSGYDNNESGFCGRPRRLLHNHTRRTVGQRPISSFFCPWQRHVC